jgi:signal peptidase I
MEAGRLVTAMTTYRAPAAFFPESLRPAAAVTPPAPQAAPVRRSGIRGWAGTAVTAVMGLGAMALLLVSVGPMLLPFQTFSVLSGSMQPNIPTGSVVVVTRVAAGDVKVGDVITFQPPGRSNFVTHRVQTLDNSSGLPVVTTKGDANVTADPWKLTLRGSGWRYLFTIPLAGYVLSAAQSGFGRLALVLLPGLGLALIYVLEELRPRRRAA